jgi:hypothetical protein
VTSSMPLLAPGRVPLLQVNPSGCLGAGRELLFEYGQGCRPLDFVLRYGFCPRYVLGCCLASGGAHFLRAVVCLTKYPAAGLQVATVANGSTSPAQGASDTGIC